MKCYKRGFTLIELVIVIIILGILAGVTAPIIHNVSEATALHYDVTNVLTQGRFAMERISRDVANLRSNTASDLTLSSSQLSFTDMNGTSITYALSGSNLQRNGTTLASGANSLAISYYTINGAATASVTSVCYIRFSFNISSNDVTHNFAQTVFLRNASC